MTDENFYTWEQVLDFLTPEMPFGQFGDQFMERIGLPHGCGGYALASSPQCILVVKDEMPVDVRGCVPQRSA